MHDVSGDTSFLRLTTDGSKPLVAIVTDDKRLSTRAAKLLQSSAINTALHRTAAGFVASLAGADPHCVIMSSRLPARSGLRLHEELVDQGIVLPVIFIGTELGTAAIVRAMKTGAANFLPKSFKDLELLDAVQEAIDEDRPKRIQRRLAAGYWILFDTLTPREREIMDLIASGETTEEIAAKLHITVATIKSHRAQVLKKMKVRTTAGIANIATALRNTKRRATP